jgi:mannose/fructose-specific phosphotransferase system component IIA
MVRLHIEREVAGAISHTEGIAYVASMIFGKKENVRKVETVHDAMGFASMINGG